MSDAALCLPEIVRSRTWYRTLDRLSHMLLYEGARGATRIAALRKEI